MTQAEVDKLEAERRSSFRAISAAAPGTGEMLEAVRRYNAAVLNSEWRRSMSTEKETEEEKPVPCGAGDQYCAGLPTKPEPELAILDVINALRAVIASLHRWQDADQQLSTRDTEDLLNLLADAEAKLQLP